MLKLLNSYCTRCSDPRTHLDQFLLHINTPCASTSQTGAVEASTASTTAASSGATSSGTSASAGQCASAGSAASSTGSTATSSSPSAAASPSAHTYSAGIYPPPQSPLSAAPRPRAPCVGTSIAPFRTVSHSRRSCHPASSHAPPTRGRGVRLPRGRPRRLWLAVRDGAIALEAHRASSPYAVSSSLRRTRHRSRKPLAAKRPRCPSQKRSPRTHQVIAARMKSTPACSTS